MSKLVAIFVVPVLLDVIFHEEWPRPVGVCVLLCAALMRLFLFKLMM